MEELANICNEYEDVFSIIVVLELIEIIIEFLREIY